MSKRTILMSAFVIGVTLALCAAGASAQNDAPTQTESAKKPVNAMCPIGKEPVQPNGRTVEHKGHAIGFCCPGCIDAFQAWDEPRKDEFVRLAMLGREPGQEIYGKADDDGAQKPAATQPAAVESDPYTLGTCPVSGEKLGAMGDPVVKTYDGREVRFCCANCIEPFEKEQAKHFKQIDEKMIERQLPYYPLETCVVSGQKLGSMGEPVNMIYANRLVRFCCSGCIDEFKADPETHFRKIDEAIVKQQRDAYPLDICIVTGMKLGSMGEPAEEIVGTRLIRYCCASCKDTLREEPAKYIKRLDDAWKARRASESSD